MSSKLSFVEVLQDANLSSERSFVDLWDQPHVAFEHMQKGRKDLGAIVHSMRSLQMLHDNFGISLQQEIKKSAVLLNGSVKHCWSKFCESQLKLAEHHRDTAQDITAFRLKYEDWIRSTKSRCDELNNELSKLQENIESYKEKQSRPRQRCSDLLKKTQQVLLEKRDVEHKYGYQSKSRGSFQRDQTLDKYMKEMQRHKQTYERLQQVREAEQKRYEKRNVATLQELQKMETARIEQSQQMFKKINRSFSYTKRKYDSISKEFVISISQIDAENDTCEFVKSAASGQPQADENPKKDDLLKTLDEILQTYSRASPPGSPFSDRRSTVTALTALVDDDLIWKELPGKGSQIEVGNSEDFILLNKSKLYICGKSKILRNKKCGVLAQDSDWIATSIRTRSASIGSDGTICAVDKKRGHLKLLRPEATDLDNWTTLSGIDQVKHISVGSRMHMAATLVTGDVKLWDGAEWNILPGKAAQCAIGSDGELWAMTANGMIKRWRGAKWNDIPGNCSQVMVGSSQTVYIRKKSQRIYHWQHRQWKQCSGGSAESLAYFSVASDGTQARVSDNGDIKIHFTSQAIHSKRIASIQAVAAPSEPREPLPLYQDPSPPYLQNRFMQTPRESPSCNKTLSPPVYMSTDYSSGGSHASEHKERYPPDSPVSPSRDSYTLDYEASGTRSSEFRESPPLVSIYIDEPYIDIPDTSSSHTFTPLQRINSGPYRDFNNHDRTHSHSNFISPAGARGCCEILPSEIGSAYTSPDPPTEHHNYLPPPLDPNSSMPEVQKLLQAPINVADISRDDGVHSHRRQHRDNRNVHQRHQNKHQNGRGQQKPQPDDCSTNTSPISDGSSNSNPRRSSSGHSRSRSRISWFNIRGTASVIDVGSKQHIVCISHFGDIHRLNGRNWESYPGGQTAQSVGVGIDGTVVAVDFDGTVLQWRHEANSFVKLPGTANSVDVGSQDNVVIVDNGILRMWDRRKKRWIQLPGYVSQASIGSDNELWAIGHSNNEILNWTPGRENYFKGCWTTVPCSEDVCQISVGDKNSVCVRTKSHDLLMWNKHGQSVAECCWERIDVQEAEGSPSCMHFSCAADGTTGQVTSFGELQIGRIN